jgi:hypothetical protein
MDNLLITFGCSWVAGTGLHYKEDMSEEEYKNVVATTNPSIDSIKYAQCSFRGILSTKFGYTNKNFAERGSSNQRQFRFAKQYFSCPNFKKHRQDYHRIVVLWGITSTARVELYDHVYDGMVSRLFGRDQGRLTEYSKYYAKHFYDHDNEINNLSIEMSHWDLYFESIGIENFWFDTLNHHDYVFSKYGYLSKRLLIDDSPRDILSQLCVLNNIEKHDSKYHFSIFKKDTDRLDKLVEIGVLNPFSHHPTKKGHQQIAEILERNIQF